MNGKSYFKRVTKGKKVKMFCMIKKTQSRRVKQAKKVKMFV